MPDPVRLYRLIDMEDPKIVLEETGTTAEMAVHGLDFERIDKVFADIHSLFNGQYKGFRACNTKYHDFRHTMDTLMAMVRLMHGANESGASLDGRHILLGLISALMHDTGYIQKADDLEGTGAKYTTVHISRSIEFMGDYLAENGYSGLDFQVCRNTLLCTGLNIDIDKINFVSGQNELIGKMLGTADLMGQMADRNYLEKLPFLFHEFKEGGVKGFDTELDLLRNTIHFYELTKMRFKHEMGGADRFMKVHFMKRWKIDRDLYHEAMENHMKYLSSIIKNHPDNYRAYLRREKMMDELALRERSSAEEAATC